MKIYGILFVIITLVYILAPSVAVDRDKAAKPHTTTEKETQSVSEDCAPSEDGEVIKVFRVGGEAVETVSELEYLVGAVAAEMPAGYHEEALKAQAVACYTYALYNKARQERSPDKNLAGAYLSDSTTEHQGYISASERREKWGDKCDAYENKTEKAVKEVLRKALVYDGEYAMAVFHSICSGRTESAMVVWGDDVPYLRGVVSDGDKLSPDYSDTLALTAEQFCELMSLKKVGAEPSEWIGESKTSESGIVTSIEICTQSFTGADVRKSLGLRSSAFIISYSDGAFTVKTLGHGHFVGLSQYGADYMARQGSSWEDILKHYYTGVTITDV
jgi:stage II sporulation protein D